jgi:predicted short-subunit dehydrogenase-like oxidoreductase (DUF2520 family)
MTSSLPSAPASLPTAATIAVVGPGRLGVVVARALTAAGFTVHGPTGRGTTPEPADLVLLCVPDAEIPAAAGVARAAQAESTLIGHMSGATPLTDVDFGLHPLQSSTGTEPPSVFHGAGFGIAGHTPAALEAARMLAAALGGRAFPLSDDHRAAYHAAASVASNFTVTLLAAAERIAGDAGLSPDDARALLAPLVERTVENWAALGPERALTGPIARGDEVTVQRQRAAVASGTPDLLPLFDALTAATTALAKGTA